MKVLATMTFATALLAALAPPQTRHTTLVKGSPVSYGTNGFDISWVDNFTQKYYLGDRTNNAIDLVDAATDTVQRARNREDRARSEDHGPGFENAKDLSAVSRPWASAASHRGESAPTRQHSARNLSGSCLWPVRKIALGWTQIGLTCTCRKAKKLILDKRRIQ
jgi:hypothetical protein